MTSSSQSKRRFSALSLIQMFRSPWILWVGFRHLRKKNSAFLNFVTILSLLGVGLGVTAMIVVLSVMDGFEAQLKKRLSATEVHILITPDPNTVSEDSGFSEGKISRIYWNETELAKKIDAGVVGVSQVHAVLAEEVLLRSPSQVKGIRLKGVSQSRLDELNEQLVELSDPGMLVVDDPDAGRIELPGLFVGRELARSDELIPGDIVTIVSPTETQGPLSKVPRSKRFVVEGIYSTGLLDQELFDVFTKSNHVETFLRKKGVISHIEISVDEFDESPKIAAKMENLTAGFKVEDWVELNLNLFQSLKLERMAMFLVLTFVVIVASFNIVTTLTLLVMEKRKEIAIMKAMGASNRDVSAVFLSQGLWIGVIGVIGGVLAAFAVSSFLATSEMFRLPDVYYDRNLPVTFDWRYYLVVALSAFTIVLMACVYPARRAAKFHPIQGIRAG